MKKRMLIITSTCVIAICVICLAITTINKYNNGENYSTNIKTNVTTYGDQLKVNSIEKTESEFVYLSDIKPITATSGYKQVTYDTNIEGGSISLLIDGKQKQFIKGVEGHATSEIIYDLNGHNYDIFTAYLGIDASIKESPGADGVKFYIYVSNDNKQWTQKYVSPEAVKHAKDGKYVSIDINGYRYLKLYADKMKNNYGDHATYAHAKLAKSSYVEDTNPVDFIKKVAEYDQIIKNYPISNDISAYELILLQRTFVKNLGYDVLQDLCKYDKKYNDTIKWLMEDLETLKLYLTGGAPEGGSYISSIKILTDLYTKHGSDLKITTIDPVSGIADGEVYKKMMISLSLTHTRKIGFWMDETQKSNAVDRYEVYKQLRSEGLIEKKIFDTIPVINMRMTLNSLISDEQIAWLNNYSRKIGSVNPYTYIAYRDDYNYLEDQYYTADNYEKWNTKYELGKYNIPYESGHPKLWVLFEEGAVCGGLSKTGTNLNTSRGMPALVLGQPGHAAYMFYSQTPEGLGKWDLGNDVDGWTLSHWTYEGTHPIGWGTESWANGHPASVTLLAQAALNDLENYKKAEEFMFLADVYKTANANDFDNLEKIYNLAIDTQSVNYDAWKAIVSLYKTNNTKTDNDFFALSERIAESLTYYPFPMFDLLKQVDLSIKGDDTIAKSLSLKTATLNKAILATASDTVQPGNSANLAKYLLGQNDLSIASFSFNGANAGKIVLSSRFSESTTRLRYSLDGGTNWLESDNKEVLLTKEQIESITSTNDILVTLVGGSTIETIDIKEGAKPTGLYNNDLENKIIGNTSLLEWSYDLVDWTKYTTKEPNLEGNVTINIRTSSNGIFKTSLPISFKFTADTVDLHKKYISIGKLSIHEASSYQGVQVPKNTIDGNINTIWHTLWDGSDTRKFITIKTNEPMYISALQYVPRQDSANGRILSGKVYVSKDGTTWEDAATFTGWKNDTATKTIIFDKPILGSYVKLVGTETRGNYASGAMINLFEDVTLQPKAEIDSNVGTFDLYSKATANNSDLKIKITKNSETINTISLNGKSYNLSNEEDKTNLSKIMNFESTSDGYNITILSSWLSKLEVKDYPLSFTTNNNNELLYNIKIINTIIETDRLENDLGSIKLPTKIDSTFKLKIEKMSLTDDNLLIFKDYLEEKDVIGNYDISIYNENTKINYNDSVEITLKIGSEFAGKKVNVLHNKNNKIESYNTTVSKNGEISFTSVTGLSQFVIATDKDKIPEKIKAEIDSNIGIFDLYNKSNNNKDLKIKITKNSETINSISLNGKNYNLNNEEDKNNLSKIMKFESTTDGYNVTILSSWLSKLEVKDYPLSFVTNNNNKLQYNIHVVNTMVKTDKLETDIGSIKLPTNIDATFKLKIEKMSITDNNILSFKDYLIDKNVLGNYDISIYDENTKVNYNDNVNITLKIGSQFAGKKVSILHKKNNKIEVYSAIVNKNGEVSFSSITGLSQFVVITDKDKTPPKPEEPTKPTNPSDNNSGNNNSNSNTGNNNNNTSNNSPEDNVNNIEDNNQDNNNNPKDEDLVNDNLNNNNSENNNLDEDNSETNSIKNEKDKNQKNAIWIVSICIIVTIVVGIGLFIFKQVSNNRNSG